MMTRYFTLGLIAALLFFTSNRAGLAQDAVDFDRQIKPILADNCFACHGIDEEARQAGLRLDQRESAIEFGAIVPGDPDESSLLDRVQTDDVDLVMPPPDSHKSLTEEQKQLLQQWITAGAEYQQHWSLVPPSRPELPTVEQLSWAKNEIDHFVLAKLEASGLSPAEPAAPRVLFRRLALDITGLPPTPAEATEFVEDFARDGDQALGDWIDRLMARPAWGEHRARYWLDAARYADTHGMHFDNYREMWPYRDWVIRSFNSNQPFDQFTREQLAGDLLEDPSRDQLIATGFQRCNMTTNEGGTIDEENLAIYAADRVQTFGWVYLGLTTNCAQCHDHKFDPISMKDYYSLAAFFRNTTQKAKDGNRKDGLGPVITVPLKEDAARWDALPGEIATTIRQRDQRRRAAKPDFENWLANVDPEDLGAMPTDGLILHLPLNEGAGNEVKNKVYQESIGVAPEEDQQRTFTATADLSWNEDGVIGPAPRLTRDSTIEVGDFGNFAVNQPYSVGCWVKASANRSGAIIGRMDNKKAYRGWDVWQNGEEFATHLIDKWTENGLKVITKGKRVKPGQWQHVMVTWDGSGKPQGLKIYVDGKLADSRVDTGTLKEGANAQIDTPLFLGRRSTGQYPFEGFVQDFLMYERQLAPTEVANIADSGPLRLALATLPEERTEPLIRTLMDNYLRNHDDAYVVLDKRLVDLQTEQETIKGRSPVTHVQVEKESQPMAQILMRGAYDRPGDQVAAAPPTALHKMPAGAPSNRLGLAQWVVDPANPLTARVTVNRFWQQLFGQGIVATAEDFGVMGTRPVNQELLDWLAVDFRESGWDVKRCFKQMLMSNTYRQAAMTSPEKLARDRDNALLSRGPRYRMDAEMVRDYALAVSGLLNRKMYGPGTRPYQPDNLWNIVGLPGGDTRKFVQDQGENLYRRSVYTFIKRMSPPPNMEAFNAPNREVCSVRRERTNTPLQALVTLNDPQFVEAARTLAEHAMKTSAGPDETLQWIANRALCRDLAESEVQILNECYSAFLEHYSANMDEAGKLIAAGDSAHDPTLDARQLAAWTMVCNQILNLDEALNK